MSDVEDAIEEVVDDRVEEVVEDGGADTTVVVVSDTDDSNSISAEALNVAEQVHEIAQEEAAEAAGQALAVSMELFQSEMGRYPTREEVAQMIAEATAAAVVAAIPDVQPVEVVEPDEVPDPRSTHPFYRKLWG